jgi:hypothetical protein
LAWIYSGQSGGSQLWNGWLIQAFTQRFACLIVGIKAWELASTSSLDKVYEGAYPER